MGSLYSKISGRSASSGTAASADAQEPAIDPSSSSSKHHPDPANATSLNQAEDTISVGEEAKVNGESDDSHLVTSSTAAVVRLITPEEEGSRDLDTDDTETNDEVNNVSLTVHPSTDDTMNNMSEHVSSESNGHNSSSTGTTPSKAETVATWAQVVAGMSGQYYLVLVSIIFLTIPSLLSTAAPPAVIAASNLTAAADLVNDADEQESVTSDDSSVNSNEVNGRSNRSSANGTGTWTRQRSSGGGKRSSSARTSTPTTSPSKRLRGSGGGDSATSSPVKTQDSERPFACRAPGCEWAFKALFHLNRHRKVVHGFNEPVTAASYQLMQQQWAAQQQQQAPGSSSHGQHQEVLEVDGHHHQHPHQQQDMNNFFDHVLLDANSPNTY